MPRSYMRKEKKKRKRIKVLKYLMVLSLGMLAIVITLLVVPQKHAGEELPESETAETETTKETEAAQESANLSGEYQVVDSSYKRVENYSWEDMYTLLVILAKTTPVEGTEKPIFTIVRAPKSQAPLLIVGKKDDDGNENIEIYVLSEMKIYLLLKTKGQFEADVKHGLLYDKAAGKIYDYEPHNLLAYDAAGVDLTAYHFQSVSYTGLKEMTDPITVEHIEEYVLKEEKEAGNEQ